MHGVSVEYVAGSLIVARRQDQDERVHGALVRLVA